MGEDTVGWKCSCAYFIMDIKGVASFMINNDYR